MRKRNRSITLRALYCHAQLASAPAAQSVPSAGGAASIIAATSGPTSKRNQITRLGQWLVSGSVNCLYVLQFKHLSKHNTPDLARTGI